MTVIKLRRPKSAAKSAKPDYEKLGQSLVSLEDKIRDVERAATVAYLMTMHDAEYPDHEPLGLFAICQVEQLATELREAFYEACERDEVTS